MSDQEVHDRTGDAAVKIKRTAEDAGSAAKDAYDNAAAKGKAVVKDAKEELGDAALKAKIIAGFKLVDQLHAEDVQVEVKDGKAFLSGSVPTVKDKMKVEGVALAVMGSSAKFESKVFVTSGTAKR